MNDITPTILSLKDLEPTPAGSYRATQHAIWERNQVIRKDVEGMFKQIIDWAARNIGYGENVEEKQATGLAMLTYLDTIEPQWAVHFAAEICEENNYHGECARLYKLLDAMQQPYRNHPEQKETVSWWAE
jgi:hypothetical protein